MENEIHLGNIKFWIDENIIYCKVYNNLNESIDWLEIDEIFQFAITSLTKNRHLPLFICLCDLNYIQCINFFKFLSNNFKLEILVLSKTFIVKNYSLVFVLFGFNFFYNLIIPNTIFINRDLAIKSCMKDYKKFEKSS